MAALRMVQVNANLDVSAVYEQTKRLFLYDFVYVMGTEGMCLNEAIALGHSNHYAHINARSIYKSFVENVPQGKEQMTESISHALKQNKLNLDASISCPLIIAEIEKQLTMGYTRFIFTDFPKTLKQRNFLEYKLNANSKAVVMEYSKRDV